MCLLYVLVVVGIDGLFILGLVVEIVFDEVLCCGVDLVVLYVWSDMGFFDFFRFNWVLIEWRNFEDE